MKIRVNWDTDGEKVEELPECVEVPEEIESEDIADWLSDKYGFCVNGIEEV